MKNTEKLERIRAGLTSNAEDFDTKVSALYTLVEEQQKEIEDLQELLSNRTWTEKVETHIKQIQEKLGW